MTIKFSSRVIIGLWLILNVATPALCQVQKIAATVVVKSVFGGIKEVDKEGSSFILETDEGDIEIIVPKQAKIFRGADRVDFADIEKEDEATIKYYEEESGKIQVLSITLAG